MKGEPGRRAFLFDLDGTLQDSEVLWVAATAAYLADQGVVIPHDQAVEMVYGHSWRDVYSRILQLLPGPREGMEAMADALRPYYLRLRDRTDIRIPGSLSLLRRLCAEHPVAIVSGATRQDVADSVQMLNIGDCLQFFLGAEDYGHGKPDPACYRLAAQRLRLPAEACTVFEDSTAGVMAAKAAGMTCVALRRPGTPAQDLSSADRILSDLSSYEP